MNVKNQEVIAIRNTSPRAHANGDGSSFFGNFSDVAGAAGGLFNNIASGISSITTAKNTTSNTNITTDPTKSTNTFLFVGIGILILILVLVFAFAFNKR
jgi:hypothetical protein